VPSTAEASVAETVIESVLTSSSPTSGRKISSAASAKLNESARQNVSASGSSTSSGPSAAAAKSARGAWRRAGWAGALAISS